jgi:hypothetical protein
MPQCAHPLLIDEHGPIPPPPPMPRDVSENTASGPSQSRASSAVVRR